MVVEYCLTNLLTCLVFFFFQAEDGIRDHCVTGVQTCALPILVHRTTRVGLRVTTAQRRRCFGLLRSAGEVWACVLEANWWRRRREAPPLVGYQQLCRELAAAGPGTRSEERRVGRGWRLWMGSN